MTSTTDSRQSSVLFIVVMTLTFAAIVISDGQTTRAVDGDSDRITEIAVDALTVTATPSTSLKDLKIPELAKSLDGRRIRIRGAARLPGFFDDFDENTEFCLIPETKLRSVHWFCSDPPLSSRIWVKLGSSETEDAVKKPFILEGIFHVDIETEGDEILGIYRISDAKVVERNVRLRAPLALHFGC